MSRAVARRQSVQRVLVVEDDADAGTLLRMLLESQGYQVVLARNGGAALASLREQDVDLVLCDLGLPDDLSGYDLARIIRDDPRLRDLPLVALTGYDRPCDRQRSEAAGFDAHLAKPVGSEGIREALGAIRGVAAEH